MLTIQNNINKYDSPLKPYIYIYTYISYTKDLIVIVG